MDVVFVFQSIRFTWNARKAETNKEKHGLTFEKAAEAFLDPFFRVVDASPAQGEERDAVIGYDTAGRLLFVVHIEVEEEEIRIISARGATTTERKLYEDQ